MNTLDIQSLLINEKNINLLNDVNSENWNIKKLLGVNITQSQAIKFGTVFQNFAKSIIHSAGGEVITQQFADINDTGNSTNKGKKDIDIWFKFNSKIYYFECKTNLDLDSEKSKATDTKVDDITNWIKNNNEGVEVVSGVLSCWFTKEIGLPVKVKNVVFMSDFFNMIGIDMTSDDYYNLMKEYGKSLTK
jgi:hypothetical protein